MPTISPSSSGLREPPGAKQLEVALGELGALLDVALVDRERQQLPVGVGVDVARGVHEVRDVGPPAAVAVGHLDRVAEQVRLRLRPQLAEAIHRELALLAALVVREALELVHRDLAEDRRDRILEVLREQREPSRRGRRGLEQAAEGERLPEHRGGLRERQRRPLVEDALRRGECRVHAVAELVRERQHVAAARRVVEQHVGMNGRDGVGAEGAAALAAARAARRSSARRRSARRARRGPGRRSRRRRARARGRSPTRRAPRPAQAAPCGRSRRGGRCRAAWPSGDTSGARARSGPSRRRRAPRPTRRSPRLRGCATASQFG